MSQHPQALFLKLLHLCAVGIGSEGPAAWMADANEPRQSTLHRRIAPRTRQLRKRAAMCAWSAENIGQKMSSAARVACILQFLRQVPDTHAIQQDILVPFGIEVWVQSVGGERRDDVVWFSLQSD